MSGSAEPLPCSSLRAWSGDLSLSHQTISQVSAGGCLVLSCSASSPEGLQTALEFGEDLWNSAECPAWTPANFQITIPTNLYCLFKFWKCARMADVSALLVQCLAALVVFYVFLSFTCGMNAVEEGRNLWPCLCLSFMDEEIASGFYSWTSLFFFYWDQGSVVVIFLINQVAALFPAVLGFAVKLPQEVFPGCPDLLVLNKAQLLFLALGPGLKIHIICKNPFHCWCFETLQC